MTIRILVTVSRSFKEFSTMRTALEKVHAEYPDAVLEHGNCDPGDVHAAGMWKAMGGTDKPHPADWPTCAPDCRPTHRRRRRNGDWYCPTAGLRRDEVMVESAPDLGLAFIDPKSKTRGAIRTAEMLVDAGIPTLIYREGVPGVETHNVAGVAP